MKGVLDMLEILVTGHEESAELLKGWDQDTTDGLVGLLDGLRER